MLWLKVGSTNRDPSVTLGYYLECVANLRGLKYHRQWTLMYASNIEFYL